MPDNEQESADEETQADRAFIDDDGVHEQPAYNEPVFEERTHVRKVGNAEEDLDEQRQKNKDRQDPRKLEPSTERGTYADIKDNYMFKLPCISRRPVPYTCLLQMHEVSSENNPYLTPQHIQYLQSPCMRQHARLFAIRPVLPSVVLGSPQYVQPLRQIDRMVPQGEDDVFQTVQVTATDKLLYANQVLQPHNGLDCSTADMGDEWLVQMDAAFSSKFLHGRRHGGNKGADTTLSLFTIRKMTDMKNDEDLMLIQHAYNGYASDLTFNKKLSCPCVNTERQELFTQYGNSKIVRDVNICMQNLYEDQDTRRDSLSYVDPVILEKTAQSRGIHTEQIQVINDVELRNFMPECRTQHVRDIQPTEKLSLHNFMTCHLHVIPSKVRDKNGKIITIVVEVLRICAHIEACDPAVALVQMISSGGHSIQEPLLRVTNNMARMLELGPVNMSNIFSCNGNEENIATLGLDANIPLAFFLFLKQNGISSQEPSPFAADFQSCRIDVFNRKEVKMYNEYLQIVKHSRRKQFQMIRTETQRDYQQGLTRASHLPIKTQTWDFQNFFSGMFYMAIPKTVYQDNLASLKEQLSVRQDVDWDKFEEDQQQFEESMADESNVYVPVHGYPLVTGYICEFNQNASKDDDWRSQKKQKTTDAHSSSTKIAESSVIALYLWSSPAYQIFIANALQEKDPFHAFIDSSMPDNADYYSLQNRSTSLTVTESTLWNAMKIKNKDRQKLSKFQSIANQVLKHYGVKGHEIHDTLKDIAKTSQTAVILPNMHESIQHHIKAWVESSANMPMMQLARGAQSLKQIARLYADTAGNARIIKDYTALARRCTNQIEAAANDDAIVAAIYMLNSQSIDIGLNYINDMTKRWMLGAVYSIWSNSFTFNPYCYPVQPCDAGGLDIYTAPSKNHNHWRKQVGDAGRWGRGKDTTFQEVGTTMNAYPKTCLPEPETRASYIANPGVENLDKATPMTLARQTAVVMNNGSINTEVSDHEQSFGRIVAFLEVAKCITDPKQLQLLWAEFERFVGSSGQGAGTQQDRYKTSQNMTQLSFYHTNDGPAICFASNANSQNQYESFVTGARCNRTPCGTSDSTGCFQWGCLPNTQVSALAPTRKRKKAKDLDDSNFVLKGVHVLKQDDILTNEAFYLLEHLNRMFSFMHRGLCLDRIKFSRYAWIDMNVLKQNTLIITEGITKPVYTAKDIRARNFDGAFETAMMGKWTRHVIHGAFYRRMLLSNVDKHEQSHCQIEHVMLDAAKAFLFVPISVSVILSAMQLYLALVLLDVGLMIVTCMSLYYLQMKNGCPLHILASVAQRQESHLSPQELSAYHEFAQYLVDSVCTDRVMQRSLPQAFSEDTLRKLAAAKTVLPSTFARMVEPDSENMPTTYLASTFFNVDPSVGPIQEEKSADLTSNATSEIMAAWFAQQQAQAQTEKNSPAEQFWTHAVEGCGMPQPTSSSNTAGNTSNFIKPQNCYKWYEGVMHNVGNAHGVIQKFVHLCNMDEESSRLELVVAILQVFFEKHPAQRDRFMLAVSHNGMLSPAWTAPIINPETDFVAGDVFTWTVRPKQNPQHQPSNFVAYSGLQVAMATDVLFVILGQALYAAEWKKNAAENSVVVHTRNMANAAEVLVFLMLHTAIPAAYVPAHKDLVVLSEPSHKREHNNRPVMIEYRRYLHVNHSDGKHCFLDTRHRNPKNYSNITTSLGEHMALHKKHLKANSLAFTIKKHELFTYPAESMAHILPYVEHLRDAVISYSYKQTVRPFADSAFVFAVLEFGRFITAEHVMHIPSTLTDCAAQEEIPCITWQHGFMFVLRVHGKTTTLHAVAPTHPDAHDRYSQLPLRADLDCIEFPTTHLSYAMAHGLVLQDGEVAYQPAPCGAKQDYIPSLPFLMFPIVQFDTLLLLKIDTTLQSFGMDPDNTYDDLTIGLLCKHEDSNTYLKHGHHAVKYYDSNHETVVQNVDFLFVSQCMLMEGSELYVRLPVEDMQPMLQHMHNAPQNDHIGNRRFGLDADDMLDGQTHVFIKCFYTLYPDKHTNTLQDKKIRVLFSIHETDTEECTFVVQDMHLFNSEFICNFHVMPPKDDTQVLLHFVWK